MKILFLSLLPLCFFQNIFCQISGKFATANGQPVPFASVLLLKSVDTSVVKNTLTNEKGIYQIENILQGKYILQFSSVGYQTWHSQVFELTSSQNSKDFGTQIMQEDTGQMSEVVVRARKPLFQQLPEGTIVNVESSVLTKGSSVLEVLERSPGVVIDLRNNSINLNGKSGVMVMINGKLLHMTIEQVVSLLSSMSADDIEKIELLTTPPPKYDAEGSAGLINIVLKKNKKPGTNGSVSLTGGYGYREKGTAGINISHNTKNINLYGSYTFSHDRPYTDLYITSAQNMPFLGGQVSVIYFDTTKGVSNNHDATIGTDVKLNQKITVGSSITYNSSVRSSTTVTNAGYNVLPDSLLTFNGINNGNNHWKNLVSSVYLEKQMREGEKINFDVDYLYFNNDAPSEVQSSFTDKHGMQASNSDSLFSPRQKGFANTTIQVGVAKIDYVKQLSKKLRLETGVKGTYTKSSSVSGIESFINGAWTGNTETSNNIVMKEGIEAAYVSVNSQLNESANFVIGARYEYSNTNMDNPKSGGNIVNRKLGVLFPGIFFSKKINSNAELQLSYTKRISRPSYNDLASYVGYGDPTAVFTGNPFLKPTITNNIKLNYNYKGYSFSLLFSRDDNAIARYQLTQSPAADMLYVSPQNLAWQNNINFQTNLPWKVNNWWTMNYSFVGGLRQFKEDYTVHPFEKTYFGYSANFIQTFKMPGKISAEFSGWYNSSSYNGTVKANGIGVLSVGIKKELKNDRGIFQLTISDLLRTEIYNVRYGTLTEEAFSIKSHVTVNTESSGFTIIKLTYSRSFGSNKTKDQRSNGSGDEQNRIRKD